MRQTLRHKQAEVFIESRTSGDRKKVIVKLLDKTLFMPTGNCETSYPVELIEKILELKGPISLCDEILRDESPDYVQRILHYDLLSYMAPEDFKGKRILDFGCGSGASTVVLGRMFPESEIVGVELRENFLSIAKLKAGHYNIADKVHFHLSPNAERLPKKLGKFDFVILSAVYEHLLPKERATVLPLIWDHLKSDGILFVNQTPYRWFPIEIHTTKGLPLINYLPDKGAHYYACHFSKRIPQDRTWEILLRRGIRGASIGEIIGTLKKCGARPVLLEPQRMEIKDRIDLWYAKTKKSRYPVFRKAFYYLLKFYNYSVGPEILPELSLAIQKSEKIK